MGNSLPEDGFVATDRGPGVPPHEFLPHPYQSLNEDAEILAVNSAWLDVLGYDRSDVEGEWFGDFLPESARDEYRTQFSAFKEAGVVSDVEFEMLHGDGHSISVSFDGIVEYDADGDVVRTHCQFTDVSGRKRWERELEQRTDELEALNRLVRHDIRNDMMVILARAELLEDYVDAQGEAYLQKILSKGDHVVELTEIARDFVETLESEDDTEVEPISIRSILRTELDTARKSYPDAEFETTGEIPEAEVRANELLGSVFRNLFNNAVQHTDKDTPVVEVDCVVGPDEVEVRVVDNGPGIPDARKQSVFGKGEKGLDSPGTGIGLYLVQQLVDQYDGRVRVEDNEPEGSVFLVQLPKADPGG